MSGRFSDTKNLHIMLRVVSDKHSPFGGRAKQEEETMEVKAEKRSKITS